MRSESVVRGEDDQRVAQLSVLLQVINQLSDRLIETGDFGIVRQQVRWDIFVAVQLAKSCRSIERNVREERRVPDKERFLVSHTAIHEICDRLDPMAADLQSRIAVSATSVRKPFGHPLGETTTPE